MLYQYTIIQINKLITVIRFRPRREKKFLQIRPGWLPIYQSQDGKQLLMIYELPRSCHFVATTAYCSNEVFA